jgi:hypothetical protein
VREGGAHLPVDDGTLKWERVRLILTRLSGDKFFEQKSAGKKKEKKKENKGPFYV